MSMKRRAANLATKSALKTFIKKTSVATKKGTPEEAGAAMSIAAKHLDKAVQRGIIHKNQAARRKSRIAKLANAAAKAPAPVAKA